MVFLADGETTEQRLRYGDLDERSRAFAASLAARVPAGERVILAYPAGVEFLVGFLGSLRAGVIPIPSGPPPQPARNGRRLARFQAVAEDATAVACVSPGRVPLHDSPAPGIAARPWAWIAHEDLLASPAPAIERPIDAHDIAYLQYTSGSTRRPKGVVVSHGALVQQLAFYRQRAGAAAEDAVMVGWLPHDHDFGLVGFLLSALYLGAPCYFMSPTAFAQKPERWLDAISRYRGTYSGGPNFAYDLCARSPVAAEPARDLSCWSIASIGGEPVNPRTLDRFAERFEHEGFRRSAFLPAYGLAEAVLSVSARQGLRAERFANGALRKNHAVAAEANQADATRLASCGTPLPGQEIAIVDPESGDRCRSDRIGEIWVRGASLADGYWQRRDETETTFHARLRGDMSGDTYLRTGDLGFLRDGELFVTGRRTDLIVVRGCNHPAEDIEWTAREAFADLVSAAGAAFLVGEHLYLVCEWKPGGHARVDEAAGAIRRAIAERHGLTTYAVVFVKPGTLPRTPSGKLQRDACREALVDGRLRVCAWHQLTGATVSDPALDRQAQTALAASSAVIEERLAAICREIVPGCHLERGISVFQAGIDSLAAQQVLGRAQAAFGLDLPVRVLFDYPTIAALAAHIAGALAERVPTAAAVVPRRDPIPDTIRRPAADWADVGPAVLQQLAALTELVTRQTEMLQALTGTHRMADRDDSVRLVSRDEDVSPLGDEQREILFLSQLAAGKGASFTVIAVVRCHDAPDGDALQRACRRIAARHDALRTVLSPDQQAQRVLPSVEPDVTLVDLTAAAGGPVAFADWLRLERSREFDFERGPLWRMQLVRQDGGHWHLVLTAHHAIADGWSAHTLLRELAEVYRADRDGSVCLLPQPMQYAAFRRALDEQRKARRDRDEAYWRGQFPTGIPLLDLPADRRRPDGLDDRAAFCSLLMDADATRRLHAFAETERCTPFVVLAAAYLSLLHRLTGQRSLAVGVDSAGRSVAGAERVIGPCSVLLPIASEADANRSVSAYVQEVRGRVLQALEHQNYRLADLLQRLDTPVDPRRPMRIAATFNMLPPTTRADRVFEPDHDATARSVTHSLFDLAVNATDTSRGIRLDFIHSTALFREATIARWAGYYQNLLAAMLASPTAPIFTLPFLPDAEVQQLAAWSAPSRGVVESPSFVRAFEAQVARTPDARAAIDDGHSATYADLDARANGVAWDLASRGIRPGAVVALLAERSLDYLAAMLGILKAGAVYLPLDPRDPDDRLRYALAHSDAAALLGVSPIPTATPVLPLGVSPARPDSPGIRLEPASAAYVIYTSGSTGRPKGAIVSHRGMINHLRAKIDALALTAADRVAQTATQSFDISVWQFLAPLVAGGEVHIFGDAVTHDPSRLLREIDRAGITVAQAVPAALQHALADVPGALSLTSLRWMISTGEALPPGVCRRWLSRFPDVPLLNAYGPTECSDDVTHQVVEWPPDAAAVRVPIGRPIAGARLYVLDPWRQPAPPDVPGELYVGGPCVGLGYLHDEDRTALAFVPDPFAGTPGARMYRTGDRVRYDGSGALDFLGRLDRQEQVNGIRVEPQEIESVLSLHPTVRHSVVVVRRSGGAAAIAAYLVFRDGYAASIGELRFFLRRRLPLYMIPSTITVMDALPLLPSGKVDRRALPDPIGRAAADRTQPAAPRTPLERDLLAIWCDVLQQTSIGIHDDLFERGGRSLDAVRVASRIAATLQLKLPIAQIYREPTVAGMAHYLRAATDPALAPTF